jgi:hypothetical protein
MSEIGAFWLAIAPSGREEWRRDLVVDLLVGLDVTVLEVEERLPTDESPRRAESATQVRGIETRRGRDVAECGNRR